MKTREDYDALLAELQEAEIQSGEPELIGRLADELQDAENCADFEDDPNYWGVMYRSACNAAGDSAAEYDIDLNDLLGRIVY